MTIKYHLDAQGGFTVGDIETGRTAYAYPTSHYATKARTQPEKVAAEMVLTNTIGSRADYDARNWATIERGTGWLPGEQAWHDAWQTHTPGPWRYEARTETIRSVPSNYWIATMNSWDGAIDNAANARLIAAAPDLLAAARNALRVAHDPWNYTEAEQVAILDAVEAVIAKAEGGV